MALTPTFLARNTDGHLIHENLKYWEETIDAHIREAKAYQDLLIPLGSRKMHDAVFPLLQRKYEEAGWSGLRQRCDKSMVLIAPVMNEDDYFALVKKEKAA